MFFSETQYQKAIEILKAGRRQLVPDGNCCEICGDSHQAFECGRNPLVAMAVCEGIAKDARSLHETLHFLAGYNSDVGGEIVGPAKVQLPEA